MAQHAQADGDLPRVRREADPRAVVVREDVVEHHLRPPALRVGRLALVLAAPPQLVSLREAGLELEARQQRLDGRLAGALVARADRDALAQQLLDGGGEGAGLGQREAAERQVCCRRGAQERRAVVRLRRGDLLHCQRLLPEVVCLGALC